MPGCATRTLWLIHSWPRLPITAGRQVFPYFTGDQQQEVYKMSTPYLSQIQMWALNWSPRGWQPCNGQLMAIAQNNALFALLGTYFGGNGTTNFGLPNFQGRLPMGFSPTHPFAQSGGSENVALNVNQMPGHNHAPVVQASTGTGTSNTPSAAAYLGALSADSNGTSINAYTKTAGTLVNLGGVSESNVGGNQPFSVLNPFLAVGFTICVEGIFPSRS